MDKRLNDKGKNWRHVFKVRLDLLLGNTVKAHTTIVVSDRVGLSFARRLGKRGDLLQR